MNLPLTERDRDIEKERGRRRHAREQTKENSLPHIDFFTDKRKSGGPSVAFYSILLLLTVLLALGGAAASASSFGSGCGCGINGGHIKSLLAAAAAAAHANFQWHLL